MSNLLLDAGTRDSMRGASRNSPTPMTIAGVARTGTRRRYARSPSGMRAFAIVMSKAASFRGGTA